MRPATIVGSASGEVVGYWVRTRAGARPVVVHAAWQTDAQAAVQVVLAATRWYWAALVLWAAISGLGIFFNINTASLRQQIVPNHLLGRVISIAGVLAWSAIPVGALAGGWAVERSGSVSLVYGVIGALVALVFLLPINRTGEVYQTAIYLLIGGLVLWAINVLVTRRTGTVVAEEDLTLGDDRPTDDRR